ncbi:hypothetical protein ACHAQJ_005126 [Trichoderma viride]
MTNHDEQEIRLLSIASPISKGNIISCSLQTISLNKAKDNFYALSYVWGDASDTAPILVNGHTFQATRNLVEALHHVPIAEPRCKQALWVDAVCINQHDIPERNSQVSIMGHIYKYAHKVVCWLGPGDETSDHVIQFINQLSGDMAAGWDGTTDFAPFHEPVYSDLVAKMHPHSLLRSPVLQHRQYWQRVWTFQEAVLARDCQIIAGSCSFLLEALDNILVWMYDFVSFMMGFTKTIRYRFSRGNGVRNVPAQVWAFVQQVYEDTDYLLPISYICTERRRTMYKGLVKNSYDEGLRLIISMRSRNATNARDKIYSAAGLASIGINVDYAASVEDVYTSYATRMIKEASSLEELLEEAGVANHNSIYAVPSWVPDWSSESPILVALQTRQFDIQQGAPAKSRSVSIASNKLCLSGVMIGNVQDVMPYTSSDGDFDMDDLEALASILRKIVEFYLRRDSQDMIKEIITQAPGAHLYPTGISVITAILQLVWMGSPLLWERDDWIWKALAPFVALLAKPTATGYLGDSEEVERSSSDGATLSSICDCGRTEPISMADLLRSIKGVKYDYLVRTSPLVQSGAAPFIVAGGLIGYAKGLVQPGDVIFAVGSAKIPLLLRKSDTGSGYKFLSCCFVAGIMEGEIWTSIENGTNNLEEIIIV